MKYGGVILYIKILGVGGGGGRGVIDSVLHSGARLCDVIVDFRMFILTIANQCNVAENFVKH